MTLCAAGLPIIGKAVRNRHSEKKMDKHVLNRMIQFLKRRSQRPFKPPKGTSWYELIYKKLGVTQLHQWYKKVQTKKREGLHVNASSEYIDVRRMGAIFIQQILQIVQILFTEIKNAHTLASVR
jgi:hypothetical protein